MHTSYYTLVLVLLARVVAAKHTTRSCSVCLFSPPPSFLHLHDDVIPTPAGEWLPARPKIIRGGSSSILFSTKFRLGGVPKTFTYSSTTSQQYDIQKRHCVPHPFYQLVPTEPGTIYMYMISCTFPFFRAQPVWIIYIYIYIYNAFYYPQLIASMHSIHTRGIS